MAAEINKTGTFNTGAGDTEFFIDMGANTINSIKYLYFSTPDSAGMDSIFLELSQDGSTVNSNDMIYYNSTPGRSFTPFDAVNNGSSQLIKAPYRYLKVSVSMPNNNQSLNWAMSYITFPSPNIPLANKFNYTSTNFVNALTANILTAQANVSTIIQGVNISRAASAEAPSYQLTVNGVPYTNFIQLPELISATFSSPLYLQPGDVLGVQADIVSSTQTNVNVSYITNT